MYVAGQQHERLAVLAFLQGENLRHGFRISGITAQSPDSVRRIQKQAAGTQHCHSLIHCLFNIHNHIFDDLFGISFRFTYRHCPQSRPPDSAVPDTESAANPAITG